VRTKRGWIEALSRRAGDARLPLCRIPTSRTWLIAQISEKPPLDVLFKRLLQEAGEAGPTDSGRANIGLETPASGGYRFSPSSGSTVS